MRTPMGSWPAARAAAFRAARKSAKLTIDDLAERLGVNRSTVVRAESGEHKLSDDIAETWLRVCGFRVVIQLVPAAADAGQGVQLTLGAAA